VALYFLLIPGRHNCIYLTNKIQHKMKRKLYLLFFTILLQVQIIPQANSIPNSVKKIIFLGNSITYMGQYVTYIDAFLTAKYPDRQFEIINVGLPSENVSGLSEPNHADGRFPRPDLHERLHRVLDTLKPDLVIACYGMNDGIYLPFDDNRFQKFKDGIEWMHKQIVKSGADIIHVTPPVFDEQKGKAYANVLDIYADWLISCRYTKSWNVIDIHWPMKKFLEEQRLADSTFKFAEDGVHPNDTGHFIIAKQIMLSFGEKEFTNTGDIKTVLSNYKNGNEILKLVEERQKILKDAWLTYIGHKRPDMNPGIPIKEAKLKNEEINLKIQALLNER